MREALRVAVVGTGSVNGAVTSQDAAVDALVSPLGLSPERSLLLGAGATAIRRRAGMVVEVVPSPGVPAAAETLPACSAAFQERLVQTLEGEFATVLPEAIALLVKHGQRLPHEALPQVLDKLPPSHRGEARPILGERARWLAGVRKEWSWAGAASLESVLPANADTLWGEGSLSIRKELLKVARQTTRDRANAWLDASWKQESADNRFALIGVLGETVAADDEPFLVRVLTDRSAQVRQTAARLLWKLPESELAIRLRTRAEGLLSATRPTGFLSKVKAAVGGGAALTLKVELPPEAFDPTWEKEGIAESTPQNLGRRQWWLAQTLAAVSPTYWQQEFSATPQELLAAASSHEFADMVLDGWTFAALQHDARDWFEPLWRAWRSRQGGGHIVAQPLHELMLKMDRDTASALAVELINAETSNLLVLGALKTPWPEPVVDAVLTRFAGMTGDITKQGHPWANLLPMLSFYAPPTRLDRTLPIPNRSELPSWHETHLIRAIESFHSTLQFRRSLHEEITR